jgi:hypothetical protein
MFYSNLHAYPPIHIALVENVTLSEESAFSLRVTF